VVLRLPTPGVSPPPPRAHGLGGAQPPSGPASATPHCRPVGEEAWPSGASVWHGPLLCRRLALHARARCPRLCPGFSPSNNPTAASPRVPEGSSSRRAGLLLAIGSFATVSRAQRGQSGTERLAAVCCLSPSPRHDRRVSRPARGTAGCGEALAGVYVKSGCIFPIRAGGGQWEWQGWR
jgi:hypothetical protein